MNRFRQYYVLLKLFYVLLIVCFITSGKIISAQSIQPNVILIMTDDQGYSHLSCQGHPNIKTPNIDAFANDAIRFTDFHQEILCAPSRAALMTGRYSSRTGAWRTSAGRAIMRAEEVTIAEIFKNNGYKTGHFGKWHLGDNYPFRSQDQGFDEVVAHKCGGVGQISDYWGNDYFDDTYYHNGELKQYKGYCADVWFNETMRYIDEVKDEPFFIYLASNTPHSPYNIADKFVQPFLDAGVPKKRAQYYGMISNVDDNMGRLFNYLDENNLTENTIIVFTTDDGASGGSFDTHDGTVNGFPLNGFNAGFRGRKASVYEGGHRTFCFWRWPEGNIVGGKDISGLTGVWDVLPTLADLCQIQLPPKLVLDGKSLKPLIGGNIPDNWKARTLFIQLHGGVRLKYLQGAPHHYIESAILKENWSLVNGKELYDLSVDKIQKNDLASRNPEIVSQLKSEYIRWFNETTPGMNEPCRIIIGSENANPVELTTQDSYTLNTNSVASVGGVLKLSQLHGPWKIHVEKEGRYNIKVSRYPVYANLQMGINSANGKKDLDLVQIRIKSGTQIVEKEASSNDIFTEFYFNLKKGDLDIQAWLIDESGEEYPGYFVLVKKV